MNPLVSVVVTAYNHSRYISATLGSVFGQTYPHYEVIVVDDGSTDDTASKILSFGGRLSCVRQTNQGPAGSRNAGIRSAKGDLVALLDGDDLWEPTKLEAQVATARRHPEAGLIAADGIQFGDDGVLRESLIPARIRQLLAAAESITLPCYERFLRGNQIPTTSQVMIPSRVLAEVGPSDPAFPIASDWDLYLRIAARYDITFLPDKLVRWRYLPTSASGPAHLRGLHWAADEISILRKHLQRVPAPQRPLIRALLKRKVSRTAQIAYHSGRARDRRWARRYLLRHLTRNPTSGAALVFLLALTAPPSLVETTKRLTRATLGWPSATRPSHPPHLKPPI